MNILKKSTEGIIHSIPIIPVCHLYIYPIVDVFSNPSNSNSLELKQESDA